MPMNSNFYSNLDPGLKSLHEKYQFDLSLFEKLASDLKLLKRLNPFITEIGVDGGAIVDMIFGYQASDFDIRYSIYDKSSKRYSRECLCERIALTLDKGNFKILKKIIQTLEILMKRY